MNVSIHLHSKYLKFAQVNVISKQFVILIFQMFLFLNMQEFNIIESNV